MRVIVLVCALATVLFGCRGVEKPLVQSPKVEQKEVVNIPDFDFLQGKFDPTTRLDQFESIRIEHADVEGMYMQKEAYASFQQMFLHAQKDGIALQIRSATRNFDRQKSIWERKWTGKTILSDGTNARNLHNEDERALKILEYSSMPGTSRHHWGTDIDLNAFENAYFESGEGKKIYDWLLTYASDYGFCQPYTEKGASRPDGYNEEKWHWSYMPLAENYTQSIADFKHKCKIGGFEGATTATSIDVVDKYILGINKACR